MTPDYARRAELVSTADDLEATARRLRTIARTVATELLRARESILCGSDGTIDPDEWAAEGEPVCDMGEGAAWEVMTVADDVVSAYAAVFSSRAADMRRAADEPRPGSYDTTLCGRVDGHRGSWFIRADGNEPLCQACEARQ